MTYIEKAELERLRFEALRAEQIRKLREMEDLNGSD